jgi:hypothetical protein
MSETFRGKTEAEYEVEMEQHRKNYSEWKTQLHQERTGFFPVFTQQFRPYLQKIQGAPIRLYLYLAMNCLNDGEVRITQKQMENFFQCSSRSIINWLDELEKFGLIKRFQVRFKSEGQIFLQPYDPMKLVQHINQK